MPSLPPSIPHPLKDEDTDEDMEDAEIEEKSKESFLHRAVTRSSKKRTAEDSGRIIVLSEKEGYISQRRVLTESTSKRRLGTMIRTYSSG